MGEPITPYKGRQAGPTIERALELYEQGVEIEKAAEEIGVPARTIHRWLATNFAERWKEVQQARASADYEQVRKRRDEAREVLTALELGEEGLDTATKARTMNWRLAHAREVLAAADTELDHQKWLLERLLRKLYGQEAPSVASAVQININLRREAAIEEKS